MSGYGSLHKAEPYFDDPNQMGSRSWVSLFEEVKAFVFKINNNTTALERTAKQLGTPRDSQSVRERLRATEESTDDLIHRAMDGMRKLTQASRAAGRDKQLQVKRLESDFKETLERYNTLQKAILERARTSVAAAPGNPFEDDDDDSQLMEAAQHRDEQLQKQAEQAQQDVEFLRDREERIRQLEGDIMDVNQIFRELAMLVREQGDVVDSIADNVYRAADNVEAGNQQLDQAATYQRRSRRKLCILLVILLVVAGVVALIIYFSVKH